MEHQHRDHIRGSRIVNGLSGNLVASKNRHPDRIALRCGDLRTTFAELDAAAARVATLLNKAGIEPGDRVGVMLPNTPAFAIAFYGVMYRGAVAVPMNPLLKAREVAYYLSNSAAKALFAAPPTAKEAVSGAEETDAQCWIVDDAELAKLPPICPSKAPRCNATTMTPPSSCTPRAPLANPRVRCSPTAVWAATPRFVRGR